MTFVSIHRPLGAYLGAFLDAGLVLNDFGEFGEFGDEPVPWLLVARLGKPR
jgi:hypothetical protein